MVYDYTWVYSNGVSVLVQNTRGSGHCAAMRWSIGVHDRDMHDRDKDGKCILRNSKVDTLDRSSSVISKGGSEFLSSRSREASEMGEFIKLNSPEASTLQDTTLTFLESRHHLERMYRIKTRHCYLLSHTPSQFTPGTSSFPKAEQITHRVTMPRFQSCSLASPSTSTVCDR